MTVLRKLRRGLPATSWLRSYHSADLASDALAGTIVAALLVPQAMAYALLAGLPPQAGLYTAVVPLALYSIFGSSRALAVGPVAVMSLLVADALAGLGELDPERAMALAALLAAGVGVLQLGSGVLRLGFLARYLGHPLLSGFTSAAALTIAFSQAPHLLGVKLPHAHLPWQKIAAPWSRLGEVDATTVFVGGAACALLWFWPRIAKRWIGRSSLPHWSKLLLPRTAPLLVVVLGASCAYLFGLAEARGLAVVGSIPRGLPHLALPPLESGPLLELAPTLFAIAFVGFLESFAIAQALAKRRGERVDGNQELVALGIANLGGSVSGAYPAAGGFGRSMVNHQAGARTGLASLVAAGCVALTLFGLTPLFYHLPRAVLAAVIVVAVIPLIDLADARKTWRESRSDGLVLVGTFVGVLFLGVELGIFAGIAMSLLAALARKPRGLDSAAEARPAPPEIGRKPD